LFQDVPDWLAPAQASAKYTWSASVADLGLGQLPQAKLYGIMPHMHQLGHRYRMSLDAGSGWQCAADVSHWNFHWQRMYFYANPYSLGANSKIEVTCDFDTSSRKEPVYPGWGTGNEMCLATLYFTVPLADLAGP
jgi:hypothetical protein